MINRFKSIQKSTKQSVKPLRTVCHKKLKGILEEKSSPEPSSNHVKFRPYKKVVDFNPMVSPVDSLRLTKFRSLDTPKARIVDEQTKLNDDILAQFDSDESEDSDIPCEKLTELEEVNRKWNEIVKRNKHK